MVPNLLPEPDAAQYLRFLFILPIFKVQMLKRISQYVLLVPRRPLPSMCDVSKILSFKTPAASQLISSSNPSVKFQLIISGDPEFVA